jgi:phosphohistidine phosphatase
MSAKRLYLLRHADSPGVPGVKDIDRELSTLGNEQAFALGQYMKSKNFLPDVVLCSHAKRTRSTLEGLTQHIDITNVEYLPILYGGSVGDYLTQIQECDNAYNSILFIAHLPNIYGLAALLAKAKDEMIAQRLATGGYAPATLSVLDVPFEHWADIQPKECPLLDVVTPDNR